MTAPIKFIPKANGSLIGGTIVISQLVSADEFRTHYFKWLGRQPDEREIEIFYDEEKQEMDIGLWDVEMQCSAEGITFAIVGLEQEAEEVKPVPAPVVLNPVNLKDIMMPKASLNVSSIHSKATMVEANNLATMTSIQTQSNVTSFDQAGAVSRDQAYHGAHAIDTRPGIAKQPPKGRLNVANNPARQRNQNYQPNTGANMANNRQSREANEGFQRNAPRRPAFDREEDRAVPSNRRPALTGGMPANPELIARLMETGIGSVRTDVDTGAYLRNLQTRQKQTRRYHDEDFVDGETCINVSAAADTPLGHMLRLSQQRPFEYPGVGRFNSLTGMYMFLTENPCGNYNNLFGNPANKELGKSIDYRRELGAVTQMTEAEATGNKVGEYDWQAIYTIMADSLWLSVNQNEELVAAILENQLAFECYTWVRPRENEGENEQLRLRHDIYGMWYVPMLREVSRALHARLKAFQAGKVALPMPDFRQAIDAGIVKLRRKMVRELIRKEQGFARPAPKQPAPRKNVFQDTAAPQTQSTNEIIFAENSFSNEELSRLMENGAIRGNVDPVAVRGVEPIPLAASSFSPPTEPYMGSLNSITTSQPFFTQTPHGAWAQMPQQVPAGDTVNELFATPAAAVQVASVSAGIEGEDSPFLELMERSATYVVPSVSANFFRGYPGFSIEEQNLQPDMKAIGEALSCKHPQELLEDGLVTGTLTSAGKAFETVGVMPATPLHNFIGAQILQRETAHRLMNERARQSTALFNAETEKFALADIDVTALANALHANTVRPSPPIEEAATSELAFGVYQKPDRVLGEVEFTAEQVKQMPPGLLDENGQPDMKAIGEALSCKHPQELLEDGLVTGTKWVGKAFETVGVMPAVSLYGNPETYKPFPDTDAGAPAVVVDVAAPTAPTSE